MVKSSSGTGFIFFISPTIFKVLSFGSYSFTRRSVTSIVCTPAALARSAVRGKGSGQGRPFAPHRRRHARQEPLTGPVLLERLGEQIPSLPLILAGSKKGSPDQSIALHRHGQRSREKSHR